MATAEESVQIDASLAEVWDAYFDRNRWPDWVDGFGSVIDLDGYPDPGGTLRWRSIPAGRGEVREVVRAHVHRRAHAVEFADSAMTGTLATLFEIRGDGTAVSQRLEYRLLARGPIAVLGGVLFVRSQLRASMRRSLEGLERVVADAAA